MNTIKRNIRFLLISRRLNKSGLAPIRCRLTYNKNRKDFSTGITVNPDYWDPKKQRLLICPNPDVLKIFYNFIEPLSD